MQTASVIKNVNALPTYLFAKVERRKLDEIQESVDDIDYVDWHAATTGRYDLAISFKGSDPKQVYSTIKRIREIDGVQSTSSLVPFEGYVRKETEGNEYLGQVFIRADGSFEELLESLRKVPNVYQVLVVPGEWDVLVTLRGESYEGILEESIEKISQIDGVRASETSFVYQPKAAE